MTIPLHRHQSTATWYRNLHRRLNARRYAQQRREYIEILQAAIEGIWGKQR